MFVGGLNHALRVRNSIFKRIDSRRGPFCGPPQTLIASLFLKVSRSEIRQVFPAAEIRKFAEIFKFSPRPIRATI